MKLSSRSKSIDYLKSNAAAIISHLDSRQGPMIITQNGEAKVVIQDIESYEQTQESLALLKILSLGNRQVEEGKVQTVNDAFKHIRERR